jgi:hypothetical protein
MKVGLVRLHGFLLGVLENSHLSAAPAFSARFLQKGGGFVCSLFSASDLNSNYENC